MPTRRDLLTALPLAGATMLPSVAKSALTARHGFNDDAIKWSLFDEGASLAARTWRPIFFLAHTTWCPHCERYRSNFFDARVVERLSRFVPVIVDRDHQPKINDRYSPDGGYVPRSMVLTPDARLLSGVSGSRSDFRWFLDYNDVSQLVAFLDEGLSQFQTRYGKDG